MENNEHFCVRHPFNGIKNWFNDELNRIKALIVFSIVVAAIVVGWCWWDYAQFTKDNTDTSGCADSTCKITTLDMQTSKYFSGTIYISK